MNGKKGAARRHNKEQVSGFQDGLMFSFENKENQSINMLQKRELTPNNNGPNNRNDMSISSISSGSP
jgi:hypothetical protein